MVASCAFSAVWSESPAGHHQFPEGPFCKSHFRIKKLLLGNSKSAMQEEDNVPIQMNGKN